MSGVIARLLALAGVDFAEALAGDLLVQSARMRSRRNGPDDPHEIRHLHAAVLAGMSDFCEPSMCRLDAANMEAYIASQRALVLAAE